MSSGIYIPQDFIDSLRAHVPNFKDETDRNQWGLALMAWEKSQKSRQHRTEHGAISFSAEKIKELFGRDKYGPLHRACFGNWTSNWSHKNHTTRGYRFSFEFRDAMDAYASMPVTAPITLLTLSGKRIKVARSLPHAISSRGTNGKTTPTADWECAKQMNRVPVNQEMLKALCRWLTGQLAEHDLEEELKPFLMRLLDIVVKMIRMSQTSLAGSGHIPQVYAIAPTGRLYARGLNLQNSPSLIKDAALHGLWEYDFVNCHFSILAQMAQERGTPCPAILHYLNNKTHTRKTIANGVAISVDQAKQCLLALLYGARTSNWFKNAIPMAIGEEAARKLYALPTFLALSTELVGARSVILSSWPRTANGSLTNASGKAITGRATPAKKLAHLLQGIEARALRAAVNLYPDAIVMMQHDGFVARCQLDCVALEQAVLDAVGYRLELEEKQVELHKDARSLVDRTKSEMAPEAASALSSDPSSDD
ncbi:MAG: hypothetical protein EOO38_12595 [Cytophagaceae bacterium]|nr:MAG: hypothetical protein EOO38_12595 [Cytophagaceae bacterium]